MLCIGDFRQHYIITLPTETLKFVLYFRPTVFIEMSESGDVGILSLPEEVLIKIAQHLGKQPELAQVVLRIQTY